MGGGVYSCDSRAVRSATLGYMTASSAEIFRSRSCNNAMNPNGIDVRESLDSKEHPNSLAFILALDVTGSMGSIPHHLVKEGLPEVMAGIMKQGIKDPQVLFLGIGDHECDEAPLQVGQFESSDELLDKWLTDIFMEGGGGGNAGESYMLAWYFAAKHTTIDCFKKRNQKGFLFTIGDEPTLKELPKTAVKKIMGSAQPEAYTSAELLDAAREKYNVYHFHVRQGSNGRSQGVMDGWKQLVGPGLVIVDDYKDIPKMIAEIVGKDVGTVEQTAPAEKAAPIVKPTEDML